MSQNGSGEFGADPRDEPAFNAPWPALALTLALLGLYAWQRQQPDQEALYYRYGLIPLEGGAPWRLLTALFVHGSWPHVLLNAVGALAFGSAISRLFGGRAAGGLAFFLFYLACGAFAGWAYLALKAGAPVVLIGASGAVSGLMGGASRLLGRDASEGRLAPFTSSTVVAMAVAWIIVNLLVAVLGFAPGAGTTPVAWEAHLAGYAAGLLLVGPFAAALRRGRSSG